MGLENCDKPILCVVSFIQGDSKLLLEFPWPMIFKMDAISKTAYGI
jgi:hypothetical protein